MILGIDFKAFKPGHDCKNIYRRTHQRSFAVKRVVQLGKDRPTNTLKKKVKIPEMSSFIL